MTYLSGLFLNKTDYENKVSDWYKSKSISRAKRISYL